jgi:CheY-like chemotaxis protein
MSRRNFTGVRCNLFKLKRIERDSPPDAAQISAGMADNLRSISSGSDVLIVEDDPVQRDELGSFLARAGLVVIVACDGETAVRHASVSPPKVAVVDYNLPDITGVEVARRLRSILPNLAIMMVSAKIGGLEEETLRQIGITAFLNKPLPLRPWRQAVLRLVQSGGRSAGQGWLASGLGSPRPEA